jgi:hypothetical protein
MRNYIRITPDNGLITDCYRYPDDQIVTESDLFETPTDVMEALSNCPEGQALYYIDGQVVMQAAPAPNPSETIPAVEV